MGICGSTKQKNENSKKEQTKIPGKKEKPLKKAKTKVETHRKLSVSTLKEDNASKGEEEIPEKKKEIKPKRKRRGSLNKKKNDFQSTADSIMKKPQDKNLEFKSSMLVTCIKKNPKEDYDIVKELGEGGYGKVFKVKSKSTGLIRAMKKISKIEGQENIETDILNEIEALKKIDHPNIVKIFEYYMDSEGYYLITEFCSGGELFEIIEQKKKLEENIIANIMYQIFNAVNYCHSTINIVHRDLKPENILIESKDIQTGFYNLKIIDFGTAKIFEKNKKENRIIGSPYYIAPEVLSKNYNEKCDIWSCGVILYILLGGKPPFYGKNDKEILNKIRNGKYTFPEKSFENVSEEAKDLINKCLTKNPSQRITAKEAMQHSFFKKFKAKNYFSNVGQYNLESTLDNLINYRPKNKLQEVALGYLVHNFPGIDEIKIINKVFNLLNTKSNGKLEKKEMKTGLNRYMPKKSKTELNKIVEQIFENVDNDNNGYIECEEFQRAGLDKRIFLDEKVLKFIFDFFDKDSSGEISLSELKEIFHVENDIESERYLKETIHEIDVDGNGEISFNEFKRMMEKIIG
ncbi:MAG: protein kinase [archaeon]|nr:protein kinase [archaeon]